MHVLVGKSICGFSLCFESRSQLSWIKPRVDVTHRWRFVERAFANRFDGVAATACS
jgi:hypothetical protein